MHIDCGFYAFAPSGRASIDSKNTCMIMKHLIIYSVSLSLKT